VSDFPSPDDFRPVEVNRAPYLHRYELSSPKLERRLTLFSWNAVLLWTAIESHASIVRFCERPGLVRFKGDWQLADFWVQQSDHREFLMLEESPKLSVLSAAPRLDSDLGQQVRTISNGELQANALWIRNWQQMLPYVVSNRRLVQPQQLARIHEICAAPKMLVDIEAAQLPSDPIVTRSAVFDLTRQGRLLAEDLHSQALGPRSRFVRS
jgi:hypothetical protein